MLDGKLEIISYETDTSKTRQEATYVGPNRHKDTESDIGDDQALQRA